VVEPGTTYLGGLRVSWLFLAGLGIIWATFLLPSPRRRSPASSVEEFERKMTMLAETNKGAPPGRWVLMPRRGHRFMGPRDRNRFRVRRRRRQVFTVLVELTGISLLIAVFPPFRAMLYGTAILTGLLLLYTAVLLRIKADEVRQAEVRRGFRERQAAGSGRRTSAVASAAAVPYGNGLAHATGGRDLFPDGAWSGDGRFDPYVGEWADALAQGGVRFVDEDVHVVVRTSEELQREAILAQASASR